MPQVVLIDYDPALFSPMGDEAERLAAVGASWETHECRTEEEVVRVAADADVIAIQSVAPTPNSRGHAQAASLQVHDPRRGRL